MFIGISKLAKRLKKDEKGFTMVEILVVLAILGIIAAILVPKFLQQPDVAREKADKLTAQSISQAVYAHKADTGLQPANLEELVTDKYLDSVPKKQKGGEFTYDRNTGTVSP